MTWNADSFFAQGKTHMVCQDYATSGVTERGHRYAIVCDGCSSSPDTDIGARLVARSAALEMRTVCFGEQVNGGWGSDSMRLVGRERRIIDTAANAANEIDVDLRCLDSTLVAAYRSTDKRQGHPVREGVRVSMRGDGVAVARGRDGGFAMYVVDHEKNAPRYLSYELEKDRLEGYLKKYGQRSRRRLYMSGSGWMDEFTTEFEGHPSDQFFPAEEFDLVVVLSDGVQTFQRMARTGTSKMLEDVPVEQVVERLLKIKGTKGEFLKRRCRKFLSNYCALNEWQHYDDFSAAAIWMGEPDD